MKQNHTSIPGFHDNLVRGINFASEVGDFSSDISFDIDHILEWINCSPNQDEYLFSVSQAILTFHYVSDLVMNISWGNSNYTKFTGDSSGFYILNIEKQKINSPLGDPDYYSWKITTNNKGQVISFGASDMSLKLIGSPQLVNRQYLLNSERINIY